MPTLIKLDNGAAVLANDDWQLLANDAVSALDKATELPANAIVPLAYWNEHHSELASRSDCAVWLDSHEPPEDIQGDVSTLPLIAINFPVFSDGRGYSYATNLRDKMQFAGDIRAIGDVLPDQLAFFRRCGFSSFDLRDDKDAEKAIRCFDNFSVSYQGASDDPEPLFRKR